jgi:hypothetical protein
MTGILRCLIRQMTTTPVTRSTSPRVVSGEANAGMAVEVDAELQLFGGSYGRAQTSWRVVTLRKSLWIFSYQRMNRLGEIPLGLILLTSPLINSSFVRRVRPTGDRFRRVAQATYR